MLPTHAQRVASDAPPDHPPPTDTLARWHQLADELRHPAVELTPEGFAPVLATYRALRSAGHEFDATLAAIVEILAGQVRGGEDDSDRDDADLMMDVDEAREDRGTNGDFGDGWGVRPPGKGAA